MTSGSFDAAVLRELTAERDRYEEALERVHAWSRAYPLKVFPEPSKEDWKHADEVLQRAGLHGITRYSASNMRHVVEGVAKIVATALRREVQP